MKRIKMFRWLAVVVCIQAWVLQAVAWPQERRQEYCQILDAVTDPVYEVGFAYLGESRFDGYGKSVMIELDADWNFAYFRDVLRGDIELDLDFLSVVIFKSAGLQLPDQVAKIAVDAGWTWRYEGGSALQVRAAPGIYSDIEEIDGDMFFVPLSCSMIQVLGPEWSGIAGIELRPGFERTIMPILGLAWEVREDLRLELRVPESKCVWYINRDWITHFGFEWQSTSFSLREHGSNGRDMITLEDLRAFLGLTHSISDQFRVTGEIGRSFGRSVEFEHDALGLDNNIDIDRAWFVRFALGGPF